jgi:hypothetical protein
MKSPINVSVTQSTLERNESSDDQGTNFLDILFAKDAAAANLVI